MRQNRQPFYCYCVYLSELQTFINPPIIYLETKYFLMDSSVKEVQKEPTVRQKTKLQQEIHQPISPMETLLIEILQFLWRGNLRVVLDHQQIVSVNLSLSLMNWRPLCLSELTPYQL